MATTKRKTVKSNPLDTIASVKKIKPAVTEPQAIAPATIEPLQAVKKPRKAPVKKVVSAEAQATVQNLAAEPSSTAKSPKSAQDIPSKQSAQATNSSPEAKTAEDILQREFSPATAMVVVPSALFKDDQLSTVHALHAVKSWSQWAVLAGLIPTPLVDTVAISGVQIKMIHDLCKIYNVTFKKEAALAVVSGLVGGSLTTTAAGMGGVFLSNLPVIGSFMKYTVQPALSYASTYAIGRVFMRHFENNGTMLNLDSKKLEAYFKDQYAKGRKMFKYEFKSSPKVQSA